MGQVVEFNGKRIEFPDGMSPADIEAQIRKNALSVPPAGKTQAPSTIDNLLGGAGNLVYGLAKGLADPVYGASQAALHGANSLYQAATPKQPSERPDNAMQRLTDGYDSLINNVENTYQADTPGSIPAGFGRFAGNMAYPIKGGGLLRAGATGAVIGATQPVVNQGDDYAKAKALQMGMGATLGTVLPVAGAALGGLYNTAKPAIAPARTVGDMLLNGVKKSQQTGADASANLPPSVAGLLGSRDPQSVIARLDGAQQLVPGSLPTTAQVAGVPQLVMAEKTLANNPAYREKMLERANANNSARLATINQYAGTPEALDAAIAARKAATEPLYAAARADVHPVDDELGALLERPSVQQALARGAKLARERGDPDPLIVPGAEGSPAVPSTPMFGALGMRIGETPGRAAVPETPSTASGQTLQYIKMGLADLQQEGKRNGMGAHEQGALGSTLDSLHNWLLTNAPNYKAADAKFAETSVPINTMQAAQAVRDALQRKTLNSGGDDAQVTLSGFDTALRSALKDQKYGIDPGAMQALSAVRNDLQRETVSNSIRSAGSDTAFNLQAPNWLAGKLYGPSLDGSPKAIPGAVGGALGGLLGGMIGFPGSGATAGATLGANLGGVVGNRVNAELERAMLEPQYFSKLLQDALARQDGSGGGLLSPTLNQGAAVGGAGLLGALSGN